jgi:AcrR family transcriptional regulator
MDQRKARTRQALLNAFQKLASQKRYEGISIADLVREARLGRSTFYEHFVGKDALMLAALEPVLLPLANAASGRGSKASLEATLAHIWKQRSLFRPLLASPARQKLARRLGEMIAIRLGCRGKALIDDIIPAMAAADGKITIIHLWVAGEVSASAPLLAQQLMAFSALRLDAH